MTATTTETRPMYRKDWSHLYKYDPSARAYVHVYQDVTIKTLKALIEAYENAQNAQSDEE